MKHLLYILLFCSCALQAQEQKYILLDSITAHYKVKQYTLNALPYAVDDTIELLNVFSDDYLLLISVLPSYDKKKWEEIPAEKVANNLLETKDVFNKLDYWLYGTPLKYTGDFTLVKKVGDKYLAANNLNEYFFVSHLPKEIHIATGKHILSTRQEAVPLPKLKEVYAQTFPKNRFPLDRGDDIYYNIPKYLENTYLAKIDKQKGETIYYFYKISNEKGITRFVYTESKGVIAGSYDKYFYLQWYYNYNRPENFIPLPENQYLWAEEVKN